MFTVIMKQANIFVDKRLFPERDVQHGTAFDLIGQRDFHPLAGFVHRHALVNLVIARVDLQGTVSFFGYVRDQQRLSVCAVAATAYRSSASRMFLISA